MCAQFREIEKLAKKKAPVLTRQDSVSESITATAKVLPACSVLFAHALTVIVS